MKKLALLLLSVCALVLLMDAAEKPVQPPPPKWEAVSEPPPTIRAAEKFQFHAHGGEIYVFEPGTGRVWKQFPDGFLKPLPYQPGAGGRMQFAPFTQAQELEEFRKQAK